MYASRKQFQTILVALIVVLLSVTISEVFGKDYYEILGVKKTDSTATIKKAFRNLALKYHPDKNPDKKNAEEQFRQIAEAYEVLSDPDRRRTYDQTGGTFSGGDGGGSGGGSHSHQHFHQDFNYNDFFKEFDEAMKRHHQAHQDAHARHHREHMRAHHENLKKNGFTFDFDDLFEDFGFGGAGIDDFGFGGFGGGFGDLDDLHGGADVLGSSFFHEGNVIYPLFIYLNLI